MDENNVVTNDVVTEEMVEILPDQPEKTGLTKTQKAIGIGILGAAGYGLVELIIHGVKLVKKWIGKLKAKKAAKEEIANADVIEVDMTAEEIENASQE